MNKKLNVLKKGGEIFVFGAIIGALIVGCSGGGSGGSSSTTNTAAVATTGVVYPVVAGLTYQTSSTSGVVASNGSYSYITGENVSFSAGGIELAAIPAASQVTPLPLDSDVASTNLLRLFKALDTDGNLSNGITLPQLTTSTLTSIDLTSASSVTAVLASLLPSATLPAASDAQVTTTLANAKTTALQSMGTYGSTYQTIILGQNNNCGTLALYPKSAVFNLTSQPNWATGAFMGTAVLTLNNNSTVNLTLTQTTGNYTASGSTVAYSLTPSYGAKSRIFFMNISPCVRLTLRDNSQPNKPPVPNFGPITVYFNTSGGPSVYNFTSIPTGPGDLMLGSKDFDGFVVSQTWTSSKGNTGTGNNFSESFSYNEAGSVTISATDDEGATASKTWIHAGGSTSGSSSLTLSGSINTTLAMNYLASSDSGPVASSTYTLPYYYYQMIDGSSGPGYKSQTKYSRGWKTGSPSVAPATGDTVLFIDVNEDTTTNAIVISFGGAAYSSGGTMGYYIGTSLINSVFCEVGSGKTYSCASAGISFNRSTGSVTFSNTPMIMVPQNTSSLAGTFTLNGSLSFNPL